jgi:hypothetical protein
VTTPRAVGVRTPYPDIPAAVREWVDHRLGSPVVSWTEQVGGMSPGCATRVVTADGSRAFVKAVGSELNPDSPVLFRREVDVLTLIGRDPLWASLRSSYDDGRWVALLLDDVPGGHPDLTDDGQMQDLLDATDRLVHRLGEVPVPPGPLANETGGAGPIDVRGRFLAWQETLDHLEEVPDALVPPELLRDPARLRDLVALVVNDDSPSQLVHWDVRVDNLLRPAPGRIVFVDWGAAGVGPPWVDPLLARLERVDQEWFDRSVAESPPLVTAGSDRVTGWLLAFGLHLAWRSTHGLADVGLPTLNEFRRTEARRFLSAAARRMA